MEYVKYIVIYMLIGFVIGINTTAEKQGRLINKSLIVATSTVLWLPVGAYLIVSADNINFNGKDK